MNIYQNIEVSIQCLNSKIKMPQYATAFSAGVDLVAILEAEFVDILPNQVCFFNTGIALEIHTDNIAGFIYSRSGLGTKDGLVVAQGVGVIDPDYRGEIIVALQNTSLQPRKVESGQRIAQLVFQPFFRANFKFERKLSKTIRGEGGFGHTGK